MRDQARTPVCRDVAATDHARILAINRAARPGVAPLDAAELARLAALSSCARVALVDAVVAGYVLALSSGARYEGEEFAWFARHFGAQEFLYVDQIAVAPRARRRGLARALYQDVECAARRSRAVALTCEVNRVPANRPSLALHRVLGFTEVGRLRTRGLEVALLSKPLTGSGGGP